MRSIAHFFIFALMLIPQTAFANLETGNSAPDFSLQDSNGKEWKLSDLKGKVVVLEWFNPECPFVKKHYGSSNMQSLQKEFIDQGVIWLTINSSAEGKQGHLDKESAKQVREEKQMNSSALLLDPNGIVGKAYGAKTTPHMFIVNQEGILVYQGAIDERPGTEAGEIPGAKNYVRQALTEVLGGQSVSEPFTKSYGCSVKYSS